MNIAFSGGGIRGLAFAGVIQALEERNLRKEVQAIIGTSSGAMIASLFSIGCSSQEIQELMKTTNFENFKDGNWSIFGDAYRFYSEFGIYKGDYAETWIEGLLKGKTGISNITFLQIFENYGIKLIITGTALNKKLTHYYNHTNTPNMKVSHAVRISMGYPIVFKPIQENDEILVDGGLLDNYPINYFFTSEKTEDQNTIGFILLSEESKPTKRMYYGNDKIANMMEYCDALIDTLCLQVERESMKTRYWKSTVGINTENISTFEFNLTNEQKETLYFNGYSATIKFLDARNAENQTKVNITN